MDLPSNRRFPRRSSLVHGLQEHFSAQIESETRSTCSLRSRDLSEDHRSGEDLSGGDLNDAGMVDQHDTTTYLYDDDEAVDHTASSNSLLVLTMELLDRHIGKWCTQPSRISDTTILRGLPNSVERNDSNTNSHYSSPDSLLSDFLNSSIDTVIEELLASPITPTSAELKGPGGRPLRVAVAINAYRRGECSTGIPFKELQPAKLRSRTGSLASMPHATDNSREASPSASRDLLLADSHTVLRHASSWDTCAEKTQEADQTPEEWYRSCPTGFQNNGKEHEVDDATQRQPTLPHTTEPGDKLLTQGIRTPPSKRLPPRPTSRPPESVQLGHASRSKKPTELQIPRSRSNENLLTGHTTQSHISSKASAPLSAPSQPYPHASPFHWAPSPYSLPPNFPESEIHPAFRQPVQYSPLRQQVLDSLGILPVYQPSHYASNYGYHPGANSSPSLPRQVVPSPNRQSSPVSSSRYSTSTNHSSSSAPSHTVESSPEEALPAEAADPVIQMPQTPSHNPGPSFSSTSMSVPLILDSDWPSNHPRHTRHLTTTVIPTSPPRLGFPVPVRSSSLANRLVWTSPRTPVLANQATVSRYFRGKESKVARVMGGDAVAEYKKEAERGVRVEKEGLVEGLVEGGKRAVKRGSGELKKMWKGGSREAKRWFGKRAP